MELKELVKKTFDIFHSETVEQLKEAIWKAIKENDESKFASFCECVEDLSVDWLQMIFQYYEADRKVKKQDYTPKSLARFVGKLAGDAEDYIDMCAGTGALTIHKWNLQKEARFVLYEYDENAIRFLIFNMLIRNIECVILHSDVLSGEIFKEYAIEKGTRFGKIREVNDDNNNQ